MKKNIFEVVKNNFDEIIISLILLIGVLTFFQTRFEIIISGIIILIVGLCITKFLNFQNGKITINYVKELKKPAFLLLIYLVYIFISSKIIGSSQNYITLNGNILIILGMAIVFNQNFKIDNLKRPLNIYKIIMTIFLVFSVIMNVNNYDRGILHFLGMSFDPNYMGSSFFLLLFLKIKDIINKEKYIGVNFIIVGLIFYFSLLSGSRGTLISMILGVSLYLLLYFLKKYNNVIKITKKNVFWGIVFLALFLILIFLLVPESTLVRFKFSSMIKLGGRNLIWIKAFKTFWWAPFLTKIIGFGAGSFINSVSCFLYGTYVASHNIFINILIEHGLIGLILFATFCISIFKEAISEKNYFSIGLIISTILMYMTIDISYNFWINLIIAYFFLYLKDNIKKEKN